MLQFEQILQRDDVPSDVKEIVMDHLDESKKDRKLLRKSEAKLRAILEAIPDLMFHVNKDGTYLSYKGAKDDLYTDPEEFLGKKIGEVMPKEIAEPTLHCIEKTLQTGELQIMTIQIPIAGKNRDFDLRMIPCGGSEVITIVREITTEETLRESEERLRGFMDSSPDGFALFDSELNLIETNEVYLAMFLSGTKKEMILGKNLIELSPDVEKTGRHEQYQKVLRTGLPINVEGLFFHPKFGKMVFSLRAFKVGRGLGIIVSDVTERKQAEESLRESEEKYRSFVENFQGVAFRGYEDFSTDLFSGKVEEVTGYSEDDFLSGKINFSQLIHPEDLSQINADVEAFMSSSMRETQREYRIIDKNGIFHWIQEYSLKFHDKDKRMGGVYGTIQDITERKKAEEETNKFKTIAEKAGYGVAITDIHGNLLYTNESFAKMHDYTTDEIINKHLSIFHTKEQMKNVERLADQLRQKGSYLAEEVWHKRKDNDIFPTLMNGTLITDEKGIPQFMAATAIDITKRKQAEEALRETEELFSQFMIHLPAAVFIKDKDSQTIFANKYLKDVFGGEKWIGKTAMELFPEEIARKMIAADQKALDEGLQIITEELTDKYNVVNIYQTYKFPIKRKNKDSLLGGIAIDITDRKQVEKTKEDLEKKRSAFVSMTSHELRTPITVIKGYAEFLDKNIEKIDTIRKAQAIQSISRNVLRLERLIEGVANITQIDEGLFELNANLCDFSKFLKETARAYKELYGIKFSIQGTLEFESPVFLNVDVDRIRQVLDNLMDNANKQTPEDGTIVLSPTILSNTIQIAISDTGVGIDPTNLERIFEQFVSITTEKASGGTGIGLYVSKIICEAHGGALTAYSEGKSQGATFIIELPRCFK